MGDEPVYGCDNCTYVGAKSSHFCSAAPGRLVGATVVRAYHIEVDSCGGCPFISDRDLRGPWRSECAHPSFKRWRFIDRSVEEIQQQPPPDWCPLRSGATIISIK